MINENLKIAIKASVDAGVEIMKVYKSDFDVEYKSDDSPLTVADKSANDVINSYLLKTNIPIISEENAQMMQPRMRRACIGSGSATTAPASVSSELYVVCSRSIAGVM